MTTAIPNAADLAAALVATAGANPETADLLAGMVIDEAERALAMGVPKPMIDHVEDAKRGFPLWFRPASSRPASASTPSRSLTERVATAAKTGAPMPHDVVAEAIAKRRSHSF